MDFVADSIIKGKPYPALAVHEARPYTQAWREFGQHWPHTTPAELFAHMDDHGVNYSLSINGGQYYTIGLGFFDFSIDYFALIKSSIMQSVQQGAVTVLFYYHEGDNPHNIKARLDALCTQHSLPVACYRFVSGNTTANAIPGFAYFPDHELLFWRRNQNVAPAKLHDHARTYEFVALSRTHKWWRASVMADLQQSSMLDRSMWSYNTNLILGDSPSDNPIEQLPGIDIPAFIHHGPYTCDTLDAEQHNDHSLTVNEHYTNAYFNLVLETHFDADGSGGTFLTEKTFKPIKNGQPFVLVAPAGSLQCLRDLGYRTFDSVLDNSYDLETNNTQRWLKIKHALKQIQQDPHGYFLRCWDDMQHNQQLFLASKSQRLNTLFTKLQSYD
jgi:hypothetical protein